MFIKHSLRRGGQELLKVPLIKGDLGGSGYVQLHIKLVLDIVGKTRRDNSLL